MKITLATKQVQDLVSRAIKCSSDNKLKPITSLMEVKFINGYLSLVTTDSVNYFRVNQQVDAKEDFSVVVIADSFAKLISRMTCDNITFEAKTGAPAPIKEPTSFVVSGGKSKYNIEIAIDSDGSVLTEIPKPSVDEIKSVEPEMIKVSAINSIIETAKPSLANNSENFIMLNAYYVGNTVMSTNQMKICSISDKLVSEPVLISAQTMDLVQLMADEGETEVAYFRNGDDIAFKTKNCSLVTKAFPGIDDYPIDVLNTFVESKFENECVVRKDDMLQALDRLSLFVGPYDRNVILMHFGKGALVLHNKNEAGEEIIDCISGSEGEFDCAIDVELFKSQIRVNSTDNVNIQYGLDKCIKIVDGNATQIVCLYVEKKGI